MINISHMETLFNVKFPIKKDDFKKAYRKQAMKYHPDLGGTQEAFTNLNNHYNQLLTLEDNRLFLDAKPVRYTRVVIQEIRSPYNQWPDFTTSTYTQVRQDMVNRWQQEFNKIFKRHFDNHFDRKK